MRLYVIAKKRDVFTLTWVIRVYFRVYIYTLWRIEAWQLNSEAQMAFTPSGDCLVLVIHFITTLIPLPTFSSHYFVKAFGLLVTSFLSLCRQ